MLKNDIVTRLLLGFDTPTRKLAKKAVQRLGYAHNNWSRQIRKWLARFLLESGKVGFGNVTL